MKRPLSQSVIWASSHMKTAIYLLTNGRYLHIGRAQANYLAEQWQTDVHLFVEDPDVSHVDPVPNDRAYVHLNALDQRLPSNVPTSKKWPKIVFLRNYVPSFLHDMDRLLYIDLDILSVKADPNLWTLPLENGFGAVSDTANLFKAPLDTGLERSDWLKKIGVPGDRYFNSGMLLVDSRYWDVDLLEASLETYFSSRNVTAIKSQDFLNSVLHDKWTELSPRWNFQPPLLDQGVKKIFDPVFLHFCNRIKPWFFPNRPGEANYDRQYEEAFSQMLKNVGVDPQSVAEPNEFRLMQSLRKSKRLFLHNMGIRTSKERRAYDEWYQQRKNVVSYINKKAADGGFADLPRFSQQDIDELPAYRFNGKKILVNPNE